MKSRLVVLAALILCSAVFSPLSAQRFNELVSRSMFADKKAFYEGDVVTILIVEFTEGQNETGTVTNSDNRTRAGAATSGWMEKAISPFQLNGQLQNRHNASGTTRTSGELTSRMSATIVEVLDNGLLAVEGTRIMEVNGEKQETVLTGLVRPEDIRPDNTIFSYSLANAQISYKGKGMVTHAGKPGILARIWNWIF